MPGKFPLPPKIYSGELMDRKKCWTVVEDGSEDGAWGIADIIPLIRKAADKASYGRWEPNHCLHNWMTGLWPDLWVVNENDIPIAVLFCRIQEYPTGLKLYEVVLMAGSKIAQWVGLLPQLAEHAKRLGCDRLTNLTHDFVADHILPHGFEIERDIYEMKYLSMPLR